MSLFSILCLTMFIITVCFIFGALYLLIAAKLTKSTTKEYIRRMLKHRFALAGAAGALSSTMTWFAMMMYSL